MKSLVCKQQMKSFKTSLQHAKVLKAKDTTDVSVFVQRFGHSFGAGGIAMKWLWWLSGLFHMFAGQPVWGDLCEAGCAPRRCSAQQRPKWKSIERVLTKAYKAKGMVRKTRGNHPALQKYRPHGVGLWKRPPPCTTPAARARVDRIVLQCLWAALPADALAAFRRRPGRETFRAAFDAFEASAREHLVGAFGSYQTKCLLDGVLAVGRWPDDMISAWPVQAPGYQAHLPKLFPGIRTQEPSSAHRRARGQRRARAGPRAHAC